MAAFSIFIMTVRSFGIGARKIGPKQPVFVIAEAGINHNGSLALAKKLASMAKKAGADCVKFQTHIADKEMIPTDIRPAKTAKQTLWDIIKNSELTEEEELKLSRHCKDKKIMFLSTPFSTSAVERLERIRIPAYKISSGSLTDRHLLHRIIQTGKPVILSTGMSDLSEIRNATKLLQKHNTPLALLQATSTYPTDYGDVNLGMIERFERLFQVPVGISDHSLGIYAALGAVARGACIVEKHITLDKKMPGPDQSISLDPGELSELVKGCRAVWQALGSSKKILKKERPVVRFARTCVVASQNISKGEVLSEKNLATKRPFTGKIPALDFFKVVGKKASRSIPVNRQLAWGDIA